MKINGVVVETQTSKIEQRPTLNQILNQMENNYQMINHSQNDLNLEKQKSYETGKTFDFDRRNFEQNFFDNQKVNTENFNNINSSPYDDKSNLLLTILPTLLSQNRSTNSLNKQRDVLINELLKKSNNPFLAKIFKLLPQLSNNKNRSLENTENVSSLKKESKIDSFRKTDDYKNDPTDS